MKSGTSVKLVKKVPRKPATVTGTGLAVVADRLRAAPDVVKRASSTLKGLPGRTKRFVKSHPVRVLVGAAAIGLVIAKLRQAV